jgi:eukaryotic-like serine/threonine-protein kinase
MPLESGTAYGQYVIEAPLGAGGIGEVYRARDRRLGRDVAIKVLQPRLLADSDALARFEREARALAAVQHPNIASIYGFEDLDGTHALVMELVDGETLAKRLARGSLSVPEALRVARQIASAIEGAHERGIVHRDLKPANVQVMRDGTVKVLDFGLARLVEPNTGLSSDVRTTLAIEVTRAGTILGTAAYMSPEQVRGEPVDRRSDIWAFGCILFEIVAGRRPFDGTTNVESLAAILEREPEWKKLPASLPPPVLKLLERCLRKDADRRPQHAGDIRIELDDALNEPAARSTKGQLNGWRIAAVLAMGVAVAALLWLARTVRSSDTTKTAGPEDPLRASISVPDDLQVTIGGTSVLALSGDGTTLVFSAVREGRRQLYIRTLNEFDVRPIPDTEDGTGPFFSPDGHWIGFFAHGQMRKVASTGGGAVTIAPAAFSRGAAWHEDGTIIFTPEPDVGLSRVSARGGLVQPLTTTDVGADELAHRWPQILPGGKAILFTVYKGVESDSSICALSLQDRKPKLLISGGTTPFYVPDPRPGERGHIIYAREQEIFAASFDLGRLEVTGPPYRIDAGVQQSSTGATALTVSSNGTIVYASGDSTSQEGLVWVDRQKGEQLAGLLPRNGRFPRVSSDGERVLLSRLERGNHDIWVYELAPTRLTRLTVDKAFDAAAVWSPDDHLIAFRSFRGQPFSIFWKPSDNSATEHRLTDAKANQVVHAWTRDGHLIYSEINASGSWDLWTVSVDGDRTPKLLLPRLDGPVVGAPSPDGRWLAYTTSESGASEVFLTEFRDGGVPVSAPRSQISLGGGVEPVWSRDGSELFYRGIESIMSVRVGTGGASKTDPPRSLFPDRYERFGEIVDFAVGPDGRFLMVRQSQPASLEIRVVKDGLRH